MLGNKRTERCLKCGLMILIFGMIGPVSSARADLSRDDYLNALKIADEHVQRQKRIAAERPHALSAALVRSLFGRFYQVGDQWTVAMIRIDPPQMRMLDDPELLQPRAGRMGIFQYQVTEVKLGESPEIALRVTQVQVEGAKPIDPKVESVQFRINDRLQQVSKAYAFSARPGLVAVSPHAIHTRISALELFPLDVPELWNVTREPGKAMPEIPDPLKALARDQGDARALSADPGKSSWFEVSDFFGRPVQALWQQGDPWPAYLKTPNGVAVLIQREARP